MRAGLIGGAGILAVMAAAQAPESPISIGFVIDNGGGMRENGRMVRAAARGLLAMVQPADEAFLMNFNRETYIDADFASSAAQLAAAAERIDFHGFSAVWDAVGQSIRHLETSGKRARKILVVVTGGDDSGSRESLGQLLQKARESGVPVYSIGLTRGAARRDGQAARRAIGALADASGGKDFYPSNLDQVEDATAQIARSIRGNSPK